MISWKPFIIPQNSFAPKASPSSFLLLLPTELILLIFDHADPLDKLCFALSCQYILQISALASLKVPFQRKICGPGCRCHLWIEGLLKRMKPVDARGKLKRSWALCIDCPQYRPTRKSYWNKKKSNCSSGKSWDIMVLRWNDKRSLQCPQCWQRERDQHYNTRP
ncbi:hypothetical protein K505DRAFT_329648 [Melanomma pulvis-pyrius CBS 109.77]|uniref:F-box domain-containing protein n=1 Tax=Melanomma pulvis-pyrius CBS 109.77 TaxID=1314802 RepID=A0A6A6WUU1_9PLEO|nr:hypothetical protein K505DRAFT_329648 [Melanomma pulvis-pyrius CBS 109.77]